MINHRHGGRNPTAEEYPAIAKLTDVLPYDDAKLIQTLTSKKVTVDPSVPDNPFTFLKHWKPFLHNGIAIFSFAN